jgi:hypothetical protein
VTHSTNPFHGGGGDVEAGDLGGLQRHDDPRRGGDVRLVGGAQTVLVLRELLAGLVGLVPGARLVAPAPEARAVRVEALRGDEEVDALLRALPEALHDARVLAAHQAVFLGHGQRGERLAVDVAVLREAAVLVLRLLGDQPLEGRQDDVASHHVPLRADRVDDGVLRRVVLSLTEEGEERETREADVVVGAGIRGRLGAPFLVADVLQLRRRPVGQVRAVLVLLVDLVTHEPKETQSDGLLGLHRRAGLASRGHVAAAGGLSAGAERRDSAALVPDAAPADADAGVAGRRRERVLGHRIADFLGQVLLGVRIELDGVADVAVRVDDLDFLGGVDLRDRVAVDDVLGLGLVLLLLLLPLLADLDRHGLDVRLLALLLDVDDGERGDADDVDDDRDDEPGGVLERRADDGGEARGLGLARRFDGAALSRFGWGRDSLGNDRLSAVRAPRLRSYPRLAGACRDDVLTAPRSEVTVHVRSLRRWSAKSTASFAHATQ